MHGDENKKERKIFLVTSIGVSVQKIWPENSTESVALWNLIIVVRSFKVSLDSPLRRYFSELSACLDTRNPFSIHQRADDSELI